MSTAATSGLSRTPAAILLFATCHQALGIYLLLLTAMIVQTQMIGTLRDFDWASASVLLLMLTLSLPRCLGGMALRRTGERAWRAAVMCFIAVAAAELGLACFGGAGLVHEPKFGLIYVGVGGSLLVLTGLVLTYLITPAARAAFGLPRLTSRLSAMSLTFVMAGAWCIATMIGAVPALLHKW